ncbi:MAG: DUF5680 domain-containing protein [Promethearchaeota archaeon]|jgi:hypothetical protein
MEIEDFLVMAKRLTYASKNSEPKQLEDGSKEYLVEIEEYIYRDRYFGENPFVGEEIVFRDGIPVWSMNYYGKATQKDEKEVFGFLVKALGKVEKKKPFRGPEKYVDGLWLYRYMSRGSVNSFWGEEEILYDGVRVYWLRFHGGEIGVAS